MAAQGHETAVRAAITAQDRTPTRMGPSATPRPSRAARATDQPADRQQCDQQSARVVANPSGFGRDVIAGQDITVSGTGHGDGPDGGRRRIRGAANFNNKLASRSKKRANLASRSKIEGVGRDRY